MEGLTAAAGLLVVTVSTPGPNNLIVLHAAARGGWRRALPVGAGVVLGGLAVLLTAVAAGSAAARLDPAVTRASSIASCLLLAGLGMAIIRRASRERPAEPASAPARGLLGLGGMLLFQFFNPKSWILVVAVVASAGRSTELAAVLPQLVLLFVLVPSASLALWSLAGRLAVRLLERPRVRRWSDRVVGGLLVGFAVLLFLGGLGEA